jgi:DNA-directed RNA polymerase subunit P
MSEPTHDVASNEIPAAEKSTNFSVFYSCMRCGTLVSQSELSRLPEIKCICGFRVFTKVRPPVVKTIKAF